jgi:hypothetical protein
MNEPTMPNVDSFISLIQIGFDIFHYNLFPFETLHSLHHELLPKKKLNKGL